MTLEQAQKLIESLPPVIADIVEFAIYTGFRKESILGLRIENIQFHDLRHVFATWLHREGVSLDALRPLMGHKNRVTTDRCTTIYRLVVGEMLSLMPHIRNQKNQKPRQIKRQGLN